jgi:hypothetical protein
VGFALAKRGEQIPTTTLEADRNQINHPPLLDQALLFDISSTRQKIAEMDFADR